jgi:hypothetical protein
MAQSRKQQQAAKRERANAAVKHAVVEVPQAMATIPESPAVAPATPIPTPARKKAAKKRHVRPQRGATLDGVAPLVRGSTHSAKSMSAGVAKSLGGAVPSGSAGTPIGRSLSAASQSSSAKSTSSRSNRRLARRRTSDS